MFPSHQHTSAPTISTLPKINRIELPPLTSDEQSLHKSTKVALSDMMPQSDYLKIYNGLNVLFIGDNSMRTLYRDLTKVLKYNRLLDYTEASRQNGKYKCIEGETNLKHEGKIGTVEYQDIKQFILPNNSTKLIYMYLSSLLNDQVLVNALNFLKDIPDLKLIDVVIFCSYTSDINEQKLSNTTLSTDNYVNNYLSCLQKFSIYLSNFCKETYKKEPILCWMSPYPSSLSLYDQRQIDFKKFVDDIDNIMINAGFFKFDRFDIWSRLKHLVIVDHGHFSLHGIRYINDCFTKTLAIKLNISYTPSIPMTATPLTPSDYRPTSFMAKKTNRFHPYN